MITPPPPLRSWAGLLRWLNHLRQYVIQSTPRPSPRCNVVPGASGSVIDPLFPVAARLGSSVTLQPFELVAASTGGESPAPRIRVVASTVAGDIPAGFSPGDDPPYLLTPTETEGYVWAGVSIDGETGEITSRWLDIGEEIDANTATEYHFLIGGYEMEDGALKVVVNYRYGPIDLRVCGGISSAFNVVIQ